MNNLFWKAVMVVVVVGVGMWCWEQLRTSNLFQPSAAKPRTLDAQVDVRPPVREGHICVTNTGSGTWRNPIFYINGVYEYHYAGNISPGEKVTMRMVAFRDRDSNAVYRKGADGFHKFDFEDAKGRFSRGD